MKTWFVYKHTSPSGKVYIGITCKKRVNDRWLNGAGYKKCPYFSHAIHKYGWNNIKHEIILEGITKSEAVYAEKYLIKWYKLHNICYNLTEGGDGLSMKMSEETKLKISKSNKGKNIGKIRSEKTKELLAKIFSKPILQLDKDTLEVISEHSSIKQAAINIGHAGSENNIAHVLHGRASIAFGYKWKFKET